MEGRGKEEVKVEMEVGSKSEGFRPWFGEWEKVKAGGGGTMEEGEVGLEREDGRRGSTPEDFRNRFGFE